MRKILLTLCLFSFMISNGQLFHVKANDFLVDSACSAGGKSTVYYPTGHASTTAYAGPSNTSNWKIIMQLGDANDTINPHVNYKLILGEIKFNNNIPTQVGAADTKISDIFSINSTDFVLEAKAVNASDSNFDCTNPKSGQKNVIRFSLLYNKTIVPNGPDITFSISATDQGVSPPVTYEIPVTMLTPKTASIDKLEKYDFSFGPNPTANFIYLSASKNIGNVEIFNLVGQKTLSTNLRDTKGTLDISNLTSGVYIMNVAIDKNIGTYKLIKQ